MEKPSQAPVLKIVTQGFCGATLVFSGVLLLPDSSGTTPFAPLTPEYSYSVWWCLRLTTILFVFPACFPPQGISKQGRVFVWSFFILASLPFSVATVYLENLRWEFFILAEIFISTLWGEVVSFFLTQPTLWWDRYYPATFTLTITPLFLYYLYWEMWDCHTSWLLWLTPYGIIAFPSLPAALPSLGFVLYLPMLQLITSKTR